MWLLLACTGAPALAAGQALVEMVQMPAWLERAGRSQPLEVDMEVKNGDRIRTGAGARAYLKLAEGSAVQIGEHAELGFYSRSLKPERDFKGALDVAKGSLRFTSSAMQSHRDISIRVGSATAVTEGADLWAKSNGENRLILLIEGKMVLGFAGKTLGIDRPMTLFATPKNAAPPIDAEQFKLWAQETEATPGAGTTRRNGKWKVVLARGGSEAEALAVFDRARAAGYAAQIRPRGAESGKLWLFDVLLARLASEQEAVAVADKLRAQLGYAAEPALN